MDITNKHSFEIARLGIGVVPQGRLIFPSLSVEENLTVGFSLGPNGWTLDNIYELFPPLKQRARHPGNKLSGGEQQMLAIGRSLMTNPSLLLMDEPTAGLSPLYVEMLGEVIRKLQRSGISILLIEQRVGFALKHVEHVNIMERGTIVHSSPPDEVEANDRAIIKKYLGV
jgi:branched-chain amino acid transport system ATP-binding protein